ncbi:glycosyltransferase family 4 protein [Micrococcus luteus]|uniref:glycosyltransferase family 4 protein n=1 Tax=Micrococcus luteus TaxID=1270 RepID=UPI00344E8828
MRGSVEESFSIRDAIREAPVYTRCLVLTSGRAADGPYGIDRLSQFGYDLMEVEPARTRVHRKLRDVVEHRSGRPMDKTLRSVRKAWRSDLVLAFLEKEALSASWAKRRGMMPYAGRPLVMIACWLADELQRMSPAQRTAVVTSYSGVDLILVLSRNQVEILVEAGFDAARIEAVTFGYDPGQFPVSNDARRYGIVSVGADRGRDFGTLIAAMNGSGLSLDLYTGGGHVQRETLPPEVKFHGRVPFAEYRQLMATASVVTIPTHVQAYPTGQTVALEAAGTGACLVLTDTPAMREYFTDETAVFVQPGDVEGWRDALTTLDADPVRRRQLGRNAAALVSERS